MKFSLQSYLFLVLIFIISGLKAQNPERFEDEILSIGQKYDTIWERGRQAVVFTGSSSIRLWKNLKDSFPAHQILNTGFGGSETSDLLHYLDELVLKYKPVKVFIYEGDNDIARGKKPKEVLRTTEEVISSIKAQGKASTVILISAKPSIERWHLKGKYKRFNRRLKKICQKDPFLEFVDVWYPMLEGRKLRTDLFVEDGLHMNEDGYKIWYKQISEFLN